MWSSHLIKAEAHSSEKSFSPAKWGGSVFGAKFRLHPQGTGSSAVGLSTEEAHGPVSQLATPAPEPRQPKSERLPARECGLCWPRGWALPLAQPQPGGYAASGTPPACEGYSRTLPRNSHSTPTTPETGLRAPERPECQQAKLLPPSRS